MELFLALSIRWDHLSQSDIARIDNRVSFLSQSQCGFFL